MGAPPVFVVEELSSGVIEDLRDASATYCSDYAYTIAFDHLFILPNRLALIQGFLDGDIAAALFADRLRDWLLRPWHSARSLGGDRMKLLGTALGKLRGEIASLPAELKLEEADGDTLVRMAAVFQQLDDCAGVGATIASKILAPLRPALFPIWDNPIAGAYGFALNAAGYRQYLKVTQDTARAVRGFWKSEQPLEQYLKPSTRRWTAPVAKVPDEWNWIRITQGRNLKRG